MTGTPHTGYSVASERLYIRGFLLLFVGLQLLSSTNLCPPPLSAIKAQSIIAWLNIVFLVYLGATRNLLPLLICMLAGSLTIAGIYLGPPLPNVDQNLLIVYGIAAAGLLALLHTLFLSARGQPDERGRARGLLHGFALVVLLSLVGPTLLPLTFTLHPMTYDHELFRLDSAFGGLPAASLAIWAESHHAFRSVLSFAYNNGTGPLLVLYGMQLAKKVDVPIKIVDVTVLSVIAALLAYHIYPVTGPIYAFGTHFPNALPRPEDVAFAKSSVFPVPRNGMPSIHFGWALATWLLAMRETPLLRPIFFLIMLLVALATLVLGEHYLIDLVVAVPFMLAAMAVSLGRSPWSGPRLRAFSWGAGLYLFWLVAMWFWIPAMVSHPVLLWSLCAMTVGVGGYWFLALQRAANSSPTAALFQRSQAIKGESGVVRMVWGMFFVSGAAALIYQVLFSRQLTYVFGSMSTATNTVLATYMGGMALGAWLGGVLASRFTRPVVAYSICELMIAIYCAATPVIFALMKLMYVALAHGSPPDAPGLLILRVGIGAAGLLVPTVLMGMTLPILARFFEQRSESLGVSVARLYTANTLGAALGAILAGYLIIPEIGVRSTTMLAVTANLFVAYLGVRLQKRLGQSSNAPLSAPVKNLSENGSVKLGILALAILIFGGFVTLALEVVDMHLLAVAAGNSTYAFSLMLFAFLLGLGGGAELGRFLMRKFRPDHLLVWMEFGLCIAILAGIQRIDDLPGYFAGFDGYPVKFGFSSREVVRAAACLVAMLPPAVLIGAIFPVAIECVGRSFPQRQIFMLGVASSLNTVGNIVGVLVAGFVLLPVIGAQHSVQLLAAVCLLLGLVAAVFTGQLRSKYTVIALAVAGTSFAMQPASLDYDALTNGANVYFRPQMWGHVIDHAESLDGGLTSVNEIKSPKGGSVLTLLTNGKFQGNNAIAGEMIAQKGFALAPLLHVSERNEALVIGYGTGNTSRVLHDAGFGSLDIVDISADIFELANRHLSIVNKRVSEERNVHAYVTDGRNFLLLSDKHYDLISMEISSIWFAGAASLYNSDFYRLAGRHLTPHGVLQQWVQLHHISPLDILYVIGSMRGEFRYVWLYVIGGQGVIVASNDPTAIPSENRIRQVGSVTKLTDLFAQEGGSPREIASDLVLDPEKTDRLLDSQNAPASFFVSTDDNAHLEYSTPKGNVLPADESMNANLRMLSRAAQPVDAERQ